MSAWSLTVGESRAPFRIIARVAKAGPSCDSRAFAAAPVYLQHRAGPHGRHGRFRGCSVATRASYLGDLALINVDSAGPALWLGVFCAVSGLSLYTYKLQNASGTRDSEIVTASLLGLSGGILAVQGWRLDPILLLSELVLSSIGVYYIVQTVQLRKELDASPALYDDPRQPPTLGGYERPTNALPDDEQYQSTSQPAYNEAQQFTRANSGPRYGADDENGGGGQVPRWRPRGPDGRNGGGAPGGSSQRGGYLTPGEPRPRFDGSWQQPESWDERAGRSIEGEAGPSGDEFRPSSAWQGASQRTPYDGFSEQPTRRDEEARAANGSGGEGWFRDVGNRSTPSRFGEYSDAEYYSEIEAASRGDSRQERHLASTEGSGQNGASSAPYAVDTGAEDSLRPSEDWRPRSRKAADSDQSDSDDWGRPQGPSDRGRTSR